ncbi:MAG: prephenate dehydratase [Bacteroidota bacterium]
MLSNTKRIAIQGYPGAFHEIASNHYHRGMDTNIVPVDTFAQLVELVESGERVDRGLMAIENTIAGSLLGNYQLLNDSNLHITGEVFLRIQQNLLALPGQRVEELTEVHSHPIAIAQCRKFFKNYPQIKLIESLDTALSAKNIQQRQLQSTGAIASSLAAELYGMDILAAGIETNKKNITRFLVLDRSVGKQTAEQLDKVSICFSVKHEVGSLHKVLGILVAHQANMTKVQSVPQPGSEWKYIFFIDFILEENSHLDFILKDLQNNTRALRILGRYSKGKRYDR